MVLPKADFARQFGLVWACPSLGEVLCDETWLWDHLHPKQVSRVVIPDGSTLQCCSGHGIWPGMIPNPELHCGGRQVTEMLPAAVALRVFVPASLVL